jgi:hypothetical protein
MGMGLLLGIILALLLLESALHCCLVNLLGFIDRLLFIVSAQGDGSCFRGNRKIIRFSKVLRS